MAYLSLSLEVLTTEKLPQILDLDQRCFGGLWSKEGYQREMDSPNSSLLVIHLPSVEQIIGLGCLWSILEEAHITIMAVHPDYQGRGLGKLLLYGLLKDGQKRDLERATLEVNTNNKVAIALYKKFGFQVAGVRKGYYQATGEDALIMWRKGLNYSEFTTELETWKQQIGDRLRAYNWIYEEKEAFFYTGFTDN